MLIYWYVILTLFFPLLALFNLVKQQSANTYNWWSSVFLLILIVLFIYQAGAWPYIGFNWRYIIVLVLGIFVLLIFRKRIKSKTQITKSKQNALSAVITIFILLFTYTNIEVVLGGYNKEQAIDLTFPLQNGSYAVMQGGDSEIGNAVHRYQTPDSYALDIVKLNEHKRRGTKLFSKHIADYTIYGDTIYSPCDGTIITYRDGVDENIPPTTNSKVRGGNHIVIKNGEVKILICHMQKNSIQPQKGDTVKTGEVIGLVGNTGFSIEPHLHIQAYQTFNGVNKMVPIRFNGRFLNMNDIVYSDK
ncbi:MAG TPA: M23 family metallopeptidase [Chitinophagales bacterium]|nr:M23 family metallopeptidase [Chitinophagales bacterium]